MKRNMAAAALFLAMVQGGAAFASDGGQVLSAAVVGLRGGYDANPVNRHGMRGSGFLSQSAEFETVQGNQRDGFAVSLALQNTLYEAAEFAPATTLNATFRHAMTLGEGLLLRSSVTSTAEQTWARRAASVTWRERVDREIGRVRLFVALDARFASLNERNIFALGNFLPYAENVATFGVLSGVAVKVGDAGEVGVSAQASRSAFRFPTDYLGMKRDNDRLQPNVFASGEWGGVKLEGSLSLAQVRFRSGDFAPIALPLFTARATVPLDRIGAPFRDMTLTLATQRTLEDTTLPFSVYVLSTASDARLAYRFAGGHQVALAARHKTDVYLGLGARSVLTSLGAEYEHKLSDSLTASAALSVRRVHDEGALPVSAFTIQVGLTRRLDRLGATSR